MVIRLLEAGGLGAVGFEGLAGDVFGAAAAFASVFHGAGFLVAGLFGGEVAFGRGLGWLALGQDFDYSGCVV